MQVVLAMSGGGLAVVLAMAVIWLCRAMAWRLLAASSCERWLGFLLWASGPGVGGVGERAAGTTVWLARLDDGQKDRHYLGNGVEGAYPPAGHSWVDRTTPSCRQLLPKKWFDLARSPVFPATGFLSPGNFGLAAVRDTGFGMVSS